MRLQCKALAIESSEEKHEMALAGTGQSNNQIARAGTAERIYQ
jgi:hypothetical protein